MTAATRARGAELERRLDAVEELITRCASQREIAEFCRREWGLTSRSQVQSYIARVYKRWEKERHRGRPDARLRAVRRLERIAHRAEEADELRTALAALEVLTRIEGTAFSPEDKFADATTGRLEIKVEVVGEECASEIRERREKELAEFQAQGAIVTEPEKAA